MTEQRKDVYYGVGLLATPLDSRQRGKEQDIRFFPGIFADIDIAGVNHKSGKKYPTNIAEVEAVLSNFPAPSLKVSTGGGLHVYWLFDKVYHITNEQERGRVKTVLRDMQQCLKLALRKDNYDMDSTADLARILRLPGSSNYKNEIEQQVKFLDFSAEPIPRYPLEVLEDFANQELASEKTVSYVSGAEQFPETVSVDIMINNCRFIQHCRDHAKELPEPEWHSMISNMSLAENGIAKIHEFSSAYPDYNVEETQRKIIHSQAESKPHTCQYIKETFKFTGCPSSGCPVTAPIGWSASKTGRAINTIETKLHQTGEYEDPYDTDLLDSLAILESVNLTLYQKYCGQYLDKYRRKVSKRDLCGLIKSHKEKIKQHGQENNPLVTNLKSQLLYDLVIPEGYHIRGKDIWRVKNGREEQVSFQILVVSRIWVKNTKEFWELTFSHDVDGWRRIIVEPEVIASNNQIIKLANYGILVNSGCAPGIVDYLTRFRASNHILTTLYTDHYGWQKNNQFLPGDNLEFLIKNDIGYASQTIKTAGSLEEWKHHAAKIRQFSVARLVLAASFAAPLLKVLKLRSFLLHIWGPSQGGKTAAMIAAGSVWLEKGKMVKNFNSTQVGMEYQLGLLKNLPVLVDERQITKDQGTIDKLVYMLGEDNGRTRGTKHLNIVAPVSWNTIMITSGEHPISCETSNEGIKTRTLEIYAKNVIPDDEYASQLHNLGDSCYGHAGPEFIRKILDYPLLKEDYLKKFNDIREKYPNLSASYHSYLSVLQLADELSAVWIFGCDGTAAQDESRSLVDQIVDSIANREENNEANRAWTAVHSWINQNENKFDKELRAGLEGTFPVANSERYGWIKDDHIYIYLNILKDFFHDNGFHIDRVKRDFAEKGWLVCGRDGGSTSYTIAAKRNPQESARRVYKLKLTL